MFRSVAVKMSHSLGGDNNKYKGVPPAWNRLCSRRFRAVFRGFQKKNWKTEPPANFSKSVTDKFCSLNEPMSSLTLGLGDDDILFDNDDIAFRNDDIAFRSDDILLRNDGILFSNDDIHCVRLFQSGNCLLGWYLSGTTRRISRGCSAPSGR